MVETLFCVVIAAVLGLVVAGLVLFDSIDEKLTSHETAVAEQIAGLKSASYLGAELYEAEQQLREEMRAAEVERRQKERQEERQEEHAAPTAKGRPRGGRPAGSRSSGRRPRTVDGEWR